MAEEITYSTRISIDNGNLVDAFQVNGLAIDMAGSHYCRQTQTIGYVMEEILDINGDIATPGMAFFRNHDDTNYVTIGVLHSAVFVPMFLLLPGEVVTGRLATLNVYAQADSGSVVLEFGVAEE